MPAAPFLLLKLGKERVREKIYVKLRILPLAEGQEILYTENICLTFVLHQKGGSTRAHCVPAWTGTET